MFGGYRLLRFLYVTVWFYTAPFLAISLQFWLIDE